MRHRAPARVTLCGIPLPVESIYATRDGPPGRFMRRQTAKMASHAASISTKPAHSAVERKAAQTRNLRVFKVQARISSPATGPWGAFLGPQNCRLDAACRGQAVGAARGVPVRRWEHVVVPHKGDMSEGEAKPLVGGYGCDIKQPLCWSSAGGYRESTKVPSHAASLTSLTNSRPLRWTPSAHHEYSSNDLLGST